MFLVWKGMTPRGTMLEDGLKVSSKFSENFLQKLESTLLFRLDSIWQMGYDRYD
jgi:hypothetical protein